jgi:hypothetical protein
MRNFSLVVPGSFLLPFYLHLGIKEGDTFHALTVYLLGEFPTFKLYHNFFFLTHGVCTYFNIHLPYFRMSYICVHWFIHWCSYIDSREFRLLG